MEYQDLEKRIYKTIKILVKGNKRLAKLGTENILINLDDFLREYSQDWEERLDELRSKSE